MAPPDYQEYSSDQMPYAHPTEDVTIKVISGTAQGNEKVCLVFLNSFEILN